MKRIFFFLIALISAFAANAQTGQPEFSTTASPKWYSVEFKTGGHYLKDPGSGSQLITKEPLTARNLSIVSVALGVGYGMGANSGILAQAPEAIRLIFGGSGIVPAAMVAILLNILLLKEKAEQS